MPMSLLFKEVFVADDLHAERGADERGVDGVDGTDDDALLGAAVWIGAVGAGEEGFHGGVLRGQV